MSDFYESRCNEKVEDTLNAFITAFAEQTKEKIGPCFMVFVSEDRKKVFVHSSTSKCVKTTEQDAKAMVGAMIKWMEAKFGIDLHD